jgi:hypothetical protein
VEFKFFFGPEFQKHHLQPDDPSNRLRGASFGLRLAFDLWYEPSPYSMVAADAALSSIATTNSARITYGWRVFEEMLGGIYVGPVLNISARTDTGICAWARTLPASEPRIPNGRLRPAGLRTPKAERVPTCDSIC